MSGLITSRRWLVVTIAAFAVATGATLVATRQGPGLSPDSAVYLSAGTKLAEGGGYRSYDDVEVTAFPPGLPLVVAAGARFGLAPTTTVRWGNAILAGVIAVLGLSLLRRHVAAGPGRVIAAVLIVLAQPLLAVTIMAWTEPAFIALTLVFILMLERSQSDASRIGWLLGAAGVAALGYLFRYAGLEMIPAGAIALAFSHRRSGHTALRPVGLFVATASAFPLAWMVRNRAVDGGFAGDRGASPYSLVDAVTSSAKVAGSWIVPGRLPGKLQLLIGTLIPFVCVAVLAWAWLRSRAVPALVGAEPDESTGPSLAPLVAFAGSYAVCMFPAHFLTTSDLTSRIFTPLYIPIVVLGAWALEAVPKQFSPSHRQVVFGGAVALAVGICGGQAIAFAYTAAQSAAAGVDGYTTEPSDLARAVEALPAEDSVLSNAPDALWIATGRRPVRMAPRRSDVTGRKPREMPRSFVHDVSCAPIYLAWYDGSSRFPRLSVPE